MQTPFDYWRSGAGLGDITPMGKVWPEGADFGAFLTAFIGDALVCEFGCGIGRLARLFPAERYVGVDICGQALDVARAALPGHDFRAIDQTSALPAADVTLCHTVLLHVPDDDLSATIERFSSPRIVVSEILGRQWRRDGNPPVFNRTVSNYRDVLVPLGLDLKRMARRPYPHYPGADLTVMEFAA